MTITILRLVVITLLVATASRVRAEVTERRRPNPRDERLELELRSEFATGRRSAVRLREIVARFDDPGGVWPFVANTWIPVGPDDSVTRAIVSRRLVGLGLESKDFGFVGRPVARRIDSSTSPGVFVKRIRNEKN